MTSQISGFHVSIEQKTTAEERLELPLQIIYVVFGAAVMTVRGNRYNMTQEDMILVNGMEPYTLVTEEAGVVCTVSIDYEIISQMTDDSTVVMTLNSLEISDCPYGDLRRIFRELVYFEVLGGEQTRCRKMSRLYEMVDILLRHCTQKAGLTAEKNYKSRSEQERLLQITSYINANYRDSLSLRELADSMYTSTSTLSRFFRKQTGYYFSEYLNRVRVAHAVPELTGTSRNITAIAMECGFSSPSVFSGCFHDAYGMSPQEFRKQQTRNAEDRENQMQELRRVLSARIDEIRPASEQSLQKTDIRVVEGSGTSFENPWNLVLNMGSLSALTRANVQYHMLTMAKELQMTHIKIWSVFAKDLRITDGRTRGSYNYSLVDTVLDMIVENQLAVYFDFGSRPDVIIGSRDTALLSEEVGILFESRELWEDLFQDFVRHLVHRYGKEEISGWIFDFCIDPTFRGYGRYYEDPDYDFQNVFEYAHKTLKRFAPGARVGGPVGIPNNPNKEIETFLKRCAESGILPDFVSVPLLPYEPTDGGKRFTRVPDSEFEIRQMETVKGLISQILHTEVPIYISDWNLSVSNRNTVNDSCIRGTYLCSRAHGLMSHAALCCLWVASDWISNYYDNRMILNGGGGLLSRDNIRKPAFYALWFLKELTGQVLYQDERMILTEKNPDSFRAVCVNHPGFNLGYYLKREEEITPENIDAVVSQSSPCTWTLHIDGLEEGAWYIIRTRSVSRRYGSIMDEWIRLGCENRLTREDIRYLREICVPRLSMAKARVQNGRLSHQVILDEQEFQMLHIFRITEDIR